MRRESFSELATAAEARRCGKECACPGGAGLLGAGGEGLVVRRDFKPLRVLVAL